MKKNNKKALYEKIMQNVSKEVKRTLNEARGITGQQFFDDFSDIAAANGIDPSSKEWQSIVKGYLKSLSTVKKMMTDQDVVNIFEDWACGKPYTAGFTNRDFIRYINANTSMDEYVNSDNIDPVWDSNHTIIALLLDNIDENKMALECVFDYDTFYAEVDGNGDFQVMELLSDIIKNNPAPDPNTFDINDYDSPFNDFVGKFTKADCDY